jgi:hypothetical protein
MFLDQGREIRLIQQGGLCCQTVSEGLRIVSVSKLECCVRTKPPGKKL